MKIFDADKGYLQKNHKTGISITNAERLQQALTVTEYKDRGYTGETLKKIRKKKDFTQATMAFALGISKIYLCKMEKGDKPLNTKALELIGNELC